jgi:hypothetical protein
MKYEMTEEECQRIVQRMRDGMTYEEAMAIEYPTRVKEPKIRKLKQEGQTIKETSHADLAPEFGPVSDMKGIPAANRLKPTVTYNERELSPSERARFTEAHLDTALQYARDGMPMNAAMRKALTSPESTAAHYDRLNERMTALERSGSDQDITEDECQRVCQYFRDHPGKSYGEALRYVRSH